MDRGPAPPLIVCFGDSLTAGFQSPTPEHPAGQETPYGAFLQRRLGRLARVAVSGLCGERTEEMVGRFNRDVLAVTPAWVVILGGTNDLGWNATPEAIMQNLAWMYEAASAHHVRPVAVTVPSIRVEGAEGEAKNWVAGHISRRQTLNGLIQRYCAGRGMACLDLFAETAEPDSHMLAAPYSNDGLHLTTRGYERLAMLLYDQVFASTLGEGARQGADRS